MKQLLDFAASPYGIFSMALGSYVFLVALWNLIYKLKIPKSVSSAEGPLVSVCIPARDEEKNIARCLDSLLRQTYKNIEIIVCDDGSKDDTLPILESYAERYDHIRVVRGKEKPSAWKGKTFALQQCTDLAKGDVLYTTDADTVHAPEAVAWAVERLEKRNLDAFTAMPRQITDTLGEKLVVTVVYMPAFLAPFRLLNWKRLKGIVFGIGQLFVYRTEVFRSVGGLGPVRSNITDDAAMARLLRKAGFRYEFLDTRGLVECRMYGSFKASVRGFLKNFYEIISAAPVLITSVLLAVIFGLFVVPPVLAGGSVFGGAVSAGMGFILPVVLVILALAINLTYYRSALFLALVYPIFFLILAGIVCITFVRVLRGKPPMWKTRPAGASS